MKTAQKAKAEMLSVDCQQLFERHDIERYIICADFDDDLIIGINANRSMLAIFAIQILGAALAEIFKGDPFSEIKFRKEGFDA